MVNNPIHFYMLTISGRLRNGRHSSETTHTELNHHMEVIPSHVVLYPPPKYNTTSGNPKSNLVTELSSNSQRTIPLRPIPRRWNPTAVVPPLYYLDRTNCIVPGSAPTGRRTRQSGISIHHCPVCGTPDGCQVGACA